MASLISNKNLPVYLPREIDNITESITKANYQVIVFLTILR